MKETIRGYRFAANYYDDAENKQKAIDYLFTVTDNCDRTNFDRGIEEFLRFYNLRSSHEPYFGELT